MRRQRSRGGRTLSQNFQMFAWDRRSRLIGFPDFPGVPFRADPDYPDSRIFRTVVLQIIRIPEFSRRVVPCRSRLSDIQIIRSHQKNTTAAGRETLRNGPNGTTCRAQVRQDERRQRRPINPPMGQPCASGPGPAVRRARQGQRQGRRGRRGPCRHRRRRRHRPGQDRPGQVRRRRLGRHPPPAAASAATLAAQRTMTPSPTPADPDDPAYPRRRPPS